MRCDKYSYRTFLNKRLLRQSYKNWLFLRFLHLKLQLGLFCFDKGENRINLNIKTNIFQIPYQRDKYIKKVIKYQMLLKISAILLSFFKFSAKITSYFDIISILLMQPTAPVDQRNTYNPNRERPLQKSLFLPDHYSPQSVNSPKTMPAMQDFPFNPMKRSLTTITENGSAVNLNSSQYQPQFFNSNQPPSATMIPQHSFDQRALSQQELLHHPGTSSLKNLTSMARSNVMSEADNKNFYKQKRQFIDPKVNSSFVNVQTVDVQQIINQVTLQMKEKHLPNMIKSIKKELYDDLHHFRLEFQTFKDQVKSYQNQSQQLFNWLKNNEKSIEGLIQKEHNSSSKAYKSPKKNHKEYQLEWIEAQFFALEDRLNQYQAKVYDSINHLNSKFEAEFNQKIPKLSTIKSSFPPFSIDYRESFIVSHSNKSYPQITISQKTYYIDKNGFLMDNESHYLVDNRGHQIKIDDKHFKLLQHHKILSK